MCSSVDFHQRLQKSMQPLYWQCLVCCAADASQKLVQLELAELNYLENWHDQELSNYVNV